MLLSILAAGFLTFFPYRDTPPVEQTGDNSALVYFVQNEEVINAACKNKNPSTIILGCVYSSTKKGQPPLMIIGNPCDYPDEKYARHVCHELGHVNGWPKDHPNRQVYTPPQTYPQTNSKK
jgi:hypothetical protein